MPPRKRLSTIPIVFAQDGDPVASGLRRQPCAAWREHHWIVNLSPELSGKRLELLKEIVPKLSRVTVIGSSTEPGTAQILKEMELAAGALKVKLQYLDVLSSKDIETAFQAAAKARADGVVMLGSVVFNTHRIQIVELAAKSRLPATYTQPEYVEDGGLMTYGPSINDLFRRAATYVDKILKGAKPADLASGAAEEVRVHHQSESSEADRSDDSAECAGASGSGDQVAQDPSREFILSTAEGFRTSFRLPIFD